MNNKCQIVWNITSKCNECCKFCFRKKCKENSLDENKKIVCSLSNLDIESLSISGGEALLYDDLFELVRYIKLMLPNTKLILNTNGKNIDENKLSEIISEFDAITLPIESTNNDFNDQIGRGYSHISDILKILDFCDNRIDIKINTILMKNNVEEIDKIYDVIKNYNIRRWKIFRFLPVRDAQKYIEEFSVSDELSRIIENKIENMNASSNINISYNKEKKYKTKYFIYPDGTIENNELEQIDLI